jgi:DNA-binding CsgD family transcriptional regulator/predicted negative regulator of RcsB-dependent stress response
VLCPDVIGRDSEIELLRDRIAGLTSGNGGVVVLRGEPGTGKTRLVHESTTGFEGLILSGRGVPGDSPVPYRPLAEAFLSAFRGRPLPDDPSLRGFEGQLARLDPGWGSSTPADDSPILLGEAIVRLLAVMSADTACVLVLDDVHWADSETLAVVEYLADALRDEPVLCIATTRPDPSIDELLARLVRRSPEAAVDVGPLDRASVRAMVATCLATTSPPAGLDDFVLLHSDGNPYLVEELLAGLMSAGTLDESRGSWEITGPLNPSVPASLRGSILQRLAGLDATARRVIDAAALLGREFDWELLPGIAEVDGRAVVDAMRSAVDAQLVEPFGEGFRFRHALTRETVLADLLPPDRRALAARAWPVIERANPGLPGSSSQLAADLAEAAGDTSAASARLVESARRALAAGALATAEQTVRRARQLAGDDPDDALVADELLVRVLVASGQTADALALGAAVEEGMTGGATSSTRHADLVLVLARAAIAAGELEDASDAVAEARRVAGPDVDPALGARIDAVAGEVALDRADLDAAEQHSRAAIEGARATGQVEVECESLLVLGRLLRPKGDGETQLLLRRASEVAEDAGLVRWHLRAQQELALETLMSDSDRELAATRDLAARYGAHFTVAAMDLMMADVALSNFDRAECLESARACIEASRRYGLAFAPVAHLWTAGAHALAGDDPAMQRSVDEALARDPHDPRIHADLHGRVLLTRAFVRDELETLPAILERMMGHVRAAPPTTSVYPGRVAWALLHTIDDDDLGVAARAEYHDAVGQMHLALFAQLGEVVEAVALGRTGDAQGATARMDAVYPQLVRNPIGRGIVHSHVLLVARAATRDGWGDPAHWLRGAEAWFAERGLDRLVRRARALLGETGAPVPRRGRGESEVPSSLRALGVTSREVDVLKLVMAGCSNKEIAAQLFLSPKTVERHMTSLFGRLGVRNRQELAAVGVAHLA